MRRMISVVPVALGEHSIVSKDRGSTFDHTQMMRNIKQIDWMARHLLAMTKRRL